MLPIYIVAAILGGGLALTAAFFGGHGHDGDFAGHTSDIHVGHDHDADHGEAGSGIWIPFLSLRFWTYGLAVFGFVGWLLTAFTQNNASSTFTLSIISGLSVGFVVSLLMRVAKKMQSDSSTKTKDLLGVEGLVTVPVRPSADGKVRINVRGDVIDFLALSNDERTIDIGQSIVIVAVENDRLRVIPKTDLFQELP